MVKIFRSTKKKTPEHPPGPHDDEDEEHPPGPHDDEEKR